MPCHTTQRKEEPRSISRARPFHLQLCAAGLRGGGENSPAVPKNQEPASNDDRHAHDQGNQCKDRKHRVTRLGRHADARPELAQILRLGVGRNGSTSMPASPAAPLAFSSVPFSIREVRATRLSTSLATARSSTDAALINSAAVRALSANPITLPADCTISSAVAWTTNILLGADDVIALASAATWLAKSTTPPALSRVSMTACAAACLASNVAAEAAVCALAAAAADWARNCVAVPESPSRLAMCESTHPRLIPP